MPLKYFKPITPGMRHLVLLDKSELWKGSPFKALTEALRKSGGRNNTGRITCRHMGGGHRRRYRIIDFLRQEQGPAVVQRLEYDPNRTAFIALTKYLSGKHSYIIAPQGLKIGDTVESGVNAPIRPGNTLPLMKIPVGTMIHNVELRPGKGGQMARSAGTSIQYVGQNGDRAVLKLCSKELRMVPLTCNATIGVVSNPDQKNVCLGKAGRMRWLGVRPTVRGAAMNPVDHPMGGRGHGKGRQPKTQWGKLARGPRTRKPKASDKMILTRRYGQK
eukprot:comp26909_c0_seq1/m.47129 comp26909_c0_seq1/g.47129  ORF comp26909_c0_seq1/g.47129 comp26909_c0_seq1/m.47129 type:complete len:274 (-) comp26909_c0_seq1:549-1370(-)